MNTLFLYFILNRIYYFYHVVVLFISSKIVKSALKKFSGSPLIISTLFIIFYLVLLLSTKIVKRARSKFFCFNDKVNIIEGIQRGAERM